MGESPVLLIVRYLRGVVGESQRSCHIVPLPTNGDLPDVLTACCGTRITRHQTELLTRMAGMPCELCVARSPG
ncbi:hypothetical protein M8C13_18250 [Crossiella sp. SN42]|uniref:hypothetical protein n=1 Tax=Crossiella sp. SN42 TaxID=2944808 RepID=UPI00207C5DCF|nr:hypothetical protein [Crossiella sp. SN42]MCO1577700.1 hypothetical protein [Crossiella sp. SN42]